VVLMAYREVTDDMRQSLADAVSAAQRGDERSFEMIYNAFSFPIKKFFIDKFYTSPEDAEDAAQEVFLKVYRKIGTYDPEKSVFTTWLYQVAKNHILSSYCRKKQRQKELILENHPVNVTAAVTAFENESGNMGIYKDVFQPDSPTPESELLSDEKRTIVSETIRLSMARMPSVYSEAFRLRHEEEMAYEDIALRLNVPLGTAKARIFRAREFIKKRMKTLSETDAGLRNALQLD
jgi:RNA polymerase sigma factor (sigma-70 family)